MSHSGAGEMDQFDDLAAELGEAGRLARTAGANQERPEPGFAMQLRAELLRTLPEGGAIRAARTEDGAVGMPIPPTRPLDSPDRLGERRHGAEPFGTRLRTLEALAPFGIEPEADDTGLLTALKPAMRSHIPTRVPSRHIAAGLAACAAVATLVYGSSLLWTGRPTNLADDAVAATLVRGGASSDLLAGADLRAGDEIKVTAAGRATLQLGDSYVRLAGGADLRLASLDPSQTRVEQLAGRAYHRVASGSAYQVATATVTWQVTATATTTAFDLDRYSTSDGGEQVKGLALYHDLGINGPQVQEALGEGMSATIALSPDGALGGAPIVEPIAAQTLADSWLASNAGQDARLGLPLGLLASLLSPAPTTEPTAAPTTERPAAPTDEPTVTPTDRPTEHPTLAPTQAPTATHTPKPAPKPTPRPTLRPTQQPTSQPTATGPAHLGELKVTKGTGNSYAISWPKYTGSDFQYYKLVYENWPKTPDFAGGSPYWTCNSSVSDTIWTGSIEPGDYAVRLQVVDEPDGKAVIRAQTNVVRLKVTARVTPRPTLPATQNLGALIVKDTLAGVTFSWTQYSGDFRYYKLVYETVASGKDPSYPGGSSYWAVPPAGTASWGPITIPPGYYNVRIQAIGYQDGVHPYAYAQTTVTRVHMSAP